MLSLYIMYLYIIYILCFYANMIYVCRYNIESFTCTHTHTSLSLSSQLHLLTRFQQFGTAPWILVVQDPSHQKLAYNQSQGMTNDGGMSDYMDLSE